MNEQNILRSRKRRRNINVLEFFDNNNSLYLFFLGIKYINIKYMIRNEMK
jgi:hypothetical protein